MARPGEVDSPDACAVLDADVLAHTAPTLADIRLFTSLTQAESPYAVTLSRTLPTGDEATVQNLRMRAPHGLSFDLHMPPRPFSAIDLRLSAHDFLATATVTGLHAPEDRKPTSLGVFTLFDLTAQQLGRNLTLPLAEAAFPIVHVDLDLVAAAGAGTLDVTPSILSGAEVPPSRLAQTLFTPVAETSSVTQRAQETVASFNVPAHVPVERISFVVDPAERENFSRSVQVTARTADGGRPEHLAGEISRVRLSEAGHEIREESLSLPAILGKNAQAPATVEVAVENGEARPLPLVAVRLEMRQRKICFAAPSAAQPEAIQMFYGGGETIPAPVYEFGRTFQPALPTRTAVLGPERLNKSYHPEAVHRSLNDRFPELLWLLLIGGISILGLVILRSGRSFRG